ASVRRPRLGSDAITWLRSTKPGRVSPIARSSGLRTRTPLIAIRPSFIDSTLQSELRQCPPSQPAPEQETDGAMACATPKENSRSAWPKPPQSATTTPSPATGPEAPSAPTSRQKSGSENQAQKTKCARAASVFSGTIHTLPSSPLDGRTVPPQRQK